MVKHIKNVSYIIWIIHEWFIIILLSLLCILAISGLLWDVIDWIFK